MVLMLIMLDLIGPNLLNVDESVLKLSMTAVCFNVRRTLFTTATTTTTTLLTLPCMNFLLAVRMYIFQWK